MYCPKTICVCLILLCFSGCQKEPVSVNLKLLQIFVGDIEINQYGTLSKGISTDRPITLVFSEPLDVARIDDAIRIKDSEEITVKSSIGATPNQSTITIYPDGVLKTNTIYRVEISDLLKGKKGEKFSPLQVRFQTTTGPLLIHNVLLDRNDINFSTRQIGVSSSFSLSINFSSPINEVLLNNAIKLATDKASVNLKTTLSANNKTVLVEPATQLSYLTKYVFSISNQLEGIEGESFSGYLLELYTGADPTPKFPIISDAALLTLVEEQTFKYFYNFAHPASGMARERNTSGNIVTLGGSGFGVMALIVGIERGFITRQQGLGQINKILTFLEKADRFHGVWPHWADGNTGKTIPFSANDNGADLVETALMVQGLITMRQYLHAADANEKQLIDRINTLWQAVEWNWFTRDNQNVLYWHWSPDKGWAMNMQINGYNEALIVYTLAAASTTHSITQEVYKNGWARNGAIKNNKLFYNIKLPLGYDYGGPLFFTHYSFLGLNPKNLSDQYANYWEQNVSHTLINRAYCIANPKNFVGYSSSNWGLTASDNQSGYSAHSPTNDVGVISPTAALSSMPYTPDQSMEALRFFYYTLGDRLWGEYGFYDAFNLTEGWVANSYLAIDQGPIIIMIENHRTSLLWNLFMSAPEVQAGLTKLGFNY